MAVLGALAAAVAERAGATVTEELADEGAPTAEAPEGESASVTVPIGRVEAVSAGAGLWLGGDALAATPWLDALAAALSRAEAWPTEGAAVDGARPEDWARAAALLQQG